MIRYFLLILFLFTSLLRADIQEDLQRHLPKILEQTTEVQGQFLKVEPFPDQGGSFINSVYLVTTTTGEELVLKLENPTWKDDKTLNEVVSIRYLDKHTSIPVPHIILFESDIESSPFATEYILMNRLKGNPLNHEIENLYQDKERYMELLSNLADVLAELKTIQFQEIGNFKDLGEFTVEGIVDFPTYTCNESIGSFSQYAYHWLNYYYKEMKRLSTEGHPNKKYFDRYIPMIHEWLSSMDMTFLDQSDDVFVYSHQDFVMKNILVEGTDVSAVLDWEWSGSALPEFEPKTGLDFLFTDADRELFSGLLEERGIDNFFASPPENRQLFYRMIGDIYTLISCYEWVEGKLEHTAKFLDQKLEQRKVRSDKNFDMEAFVEGKVKDLDECILKFKKNKEVIR